MGHHVEKARPQFDRDLYFNALGVIWGSSLGFLCDKLTDIMNRPADADHLEPVTLQIYNASGEYSAADMIRVKLALNATHRQVGRFFQNFDLLLTPTLAQLPVLLRKPYPGLAATPRCMSATGQHDHRW